MNAELLKPDLVDRLIRDLPPSQAVLPRLMELLSDMDSNSSEVIDLVEYDPAVSASILRASRSVFYGHLGQSVTNLEEAVSSLGFKEVYRLVSLYALAQTASRPLPVYGLTTEAFWKKSVACGLAMETLCGESGAPGATGYTIGLLHAIGEVLVDRLASLNGLSEGPRVAYSTPVPLPEQERRVCGFTQTELAALVMRRWRFPDQVIEPIEFQFVPHEAPTHTQMALRLRLAKWLAHLVIGDEATARAVNPEFHFAISIPGNSFARIVENLRDRLAAVAGALAGTGCTAA